MAHIRQFAKLIINLETTSYKALLRVEHTKSKVRDRKSPLHSSNTINQVKRRDQICSTLKPASDIFELSTTAKKLPQYL